MCLLPISKEILSDLFPNARKEDIEKFLIPLNETFLKYQINTIPRLAAFCAQIEIESGSLHYVEEIASGRAYEYRKDLGNLDKEALEAAHKYHNTTGKFYKGHGLIQITGFYNHKAVGKALGIDTINNPTILCEPLYAALSAGWYWNTHNCNSFADAGLFGAITKAINGGYNMAKERSHAYNRNKKLLLS